MMLARILRPAGPGVTHLTQYRDWANRCQSFCGRLRYDHDTTGVEVGYGPFADSRPCAMCQRRMDVSRRYENELLDNGGFTHE